MNTDKYTLNPCIISDHLKVKVKFCFKFKMFNLNDGM